MSTREYAKNLFAQWSDEDFCNQPIFDKLLFQVICGQRTVNTAGVFPINYTRWRKAMRDGDQEPTDAQLTEALHRMEQRRFIYIDENTGEGLIRSRVRRDELDKQPTVLLSALRIMAAFDSPKFAAVMLTELDRISLPTITSTTDKANRLRANLKSAWDTARAHLQALAQHYEQPSQLDPLETLSRPSPEGPNSVSGSGSGSGSSPSVGGYVERVAANTDHNGHPQPTPAHNEPPPETCPKHTDHPDPPPCGACAAHRKRRERWDREHTTRRRDTLTEFWNQVRDCPECDQDGFIDNPTGDALTRCPLHDWNAIHA
ncbi:hypothetical protein [Mycolicibacterium thermoresistibile]|uniref:Uncharacterized protein n=1 Tax=Mycolicibacterium thermoresistibile (strain ATCC 19527 / DSM 44167 / CIP 105390 / JCM 6362 / NCTC 10409 / 316) TaxID=1078020 RepID=G7CF90_MYCT3|nr:hypothetical protein [Mycolicibacterium thermoresistibile]EHI13169.1 hypothetical protein KEK_08307 [Mycolicibacterium thermoresistibile ATCC 19527]